MEQDVKSLQMKSPLKSRHRDTLNELDRYKLLVESVRDYAIFMLNADGYVQTWNKGAEVHKGYKSHEIIGKHFSSFYLENDKIAQKPERELKLAIKYGRVEDEDWRVRKDGTKFWANVIITALYDSNGELVGFAKVTRDLTERKSQENKLRKANALLRRQQHELEVLNQSKDEFISLASHQLRTPATGIKQYLGMLLEGFLGELDEKQKKYIERAFENNDRQIRIVNHLLKVAQIDAGKVLLQKEYVAVARVINDVVESLYESFAAREQNISVHAPSSLPEICIDQTYFRMALENIVDNASKYTPPGGSITIKATKKNSYVSINICDTGVGIPADMQSRIFDKFSRIPNELTDSVEGTGLGLYWVKKVIELHGGSVIMRSEEHKGTTFTLLIPIGETCA